MSEHEQLRCAPSAISTPAHAVFAGSAHAVVLRSPNRCMHHPRSLRQQAVLQPTMGVPQLGARARHNVRLSLAFRALDGVATGIWGGAVLSNYISLLFGSTPAGNQVCYHGANFIGCLAACSLRALGRAHVTAGRQQAAPHVRSSQVLLPIPHSVANPGGGRRSGGARHSPGRNRRAT